MDASANDTPSATPDPRDLKAMFKPAGRSGDDATNRAPDAPIGNAAPEPVGAGCRASGYPLEHHL